MKNKLIIVALAGLLAIPASFARVSIFKKKNREEKKEIASLAIEDDMTDDAAMVLSGEWIINRVGAIDIDSEDDYPYIYFDMEKDAFYASNGCNILNGFFTVESINTLKFQSVLSTSRYCVDTPYDAEINTVISDKNEILFTCETIDGEPYLYFSDVHGKRLMTLHKPGLDYLNEFWEVVKIEDEETEGDDITVHFDTLEGVVHCFTGCNSYNGDLIVEPHKKHTISVTHLKPTKKLNPCPDTELQSKFIVALENVTGAEPINDNMVVLVNSSSDPQLVLRKIVLKQKQD